MAVYSLSLRSGSSGNSTFVRTESARIAVDCGMSGRQFSQALESIGESARLLDALFLTHEHTDHSMGVGVVMRRYGTPLYLTEETYRAVRDQLGPLPEAQVFLIKAGSPFMVRDTEVLAFSLPHDARDPVGFRIRTSYGDIGVATDLGYFSEEVREGLTGCLQVHLEANFDPLMLEGGPYPPRLKRRISSSRGHLSNEEAGMAASWLVRQGTRALALSHLSEENNEPDLARRVVTAYLETAGAREGLDYALSVSARYQCSRPHYCHDPLGGFEDKKPLRSDRQLSLFSGDPARDKGGL